MLKDVLVTCPHCGELVSRAPICEECGGELPAATADGNDGSGKQSAGDGKAQERSSAAEVTPASTKASKVTIGKSEIAVTDENIARAEAAETFYADDEQDDCPHFRLEFNTARIFIAGWGSSFNFRLYPLLNEAVKCREAQLEVVLHEDQRLTKRIYHLRMHRHAEVDLNFSSHSCAIDNAAEVYLSYRLNERLYRYVAVFKWDCLSPEAPGKIIENLEIRMEGITAGPAAEQNINLLRDVQGASPQSVVERLSRLKLKPVWKATPLYDVIGERPVTPMAEVRHLSLIGPNKERIHLLSGREITIARKPKKLAPGTKPPDIAASVIDATGGEDVYASGFIHRDHASIVEAAGSYQLVDHGSPASFGNGSAPLRNGTFLNGARINDGGTVTLPPGVEHEIGLSVPPSQKRPYFKLSARVLLDSRTKDPSALVIKRNDCLNECFVHVARAISLKHLMKDATAVKIRRRMNAFQIEADDWEDWLQPGMSVPGLPGWYCIHYKQIGHD